MKKITINANSYIKGHANNSMHSFGKGLIVDGGNNKSDIVWQFQILSSGVYSVISTYASNDLRPVELKIDDKIISSRALANTTGGWCIDNIKKHLEGDCFLTAGHHLLRITSNSFIPHIYNFQIILKNNTTDPLKMTFKETLKEKFSINPYKNPNPSLTKKLINSLINNGLSATIKKASSFISPSNIFKRDFADILGIYTKRYAFTGPKLVQVDITNNCNNNCIGCWCNSPLLEEQKMPLEQKQKFIPLRKCVDILNELSLLNCKELYFSGGGEPFTHPDILSILRTAKELGFIVYVNTNFTLLSKDLIKEIIDIGVDHLTVSIWAGTAKTYVATHPNKTQNDFFILKENLSFLNRIKDQTPYTKVYHVISSINYHEFESMLDFAIATGSDSVEYTMVDIIPKKTESLLLNATELKKLKEEVKSVSKRQNEITIFEFDKFLSRIEDTNHTILGNYDSRQVKDTLCTIGWTFARINADGDVNGCLKSHKIPVGNIFKSSFKDIWNGKKQQEFRQHTYAMKPADPFLKHIGNADDCDLGCIRSCDDLGRNQTMEKKLKQISFISKLLLKLIALPYRLNLLQNSIKLKPVKKLPELLDVKGFTDGKKAFQFPTHIAIDPTNRCNNRCTACFTYSPLLKDNKIKKEWFKKEIDKDILLSLIQELSRKGVQRIRFSGGGEPLLYPYILEAISCARKHNIYTSITTSLFRIKRDFLKKLTDTGLNEISISLMGANSESYKKTHPFATEEDFEELQNNIKYLIQKQRLKVTLCQVIFNKNYLHLKEMIYMAEKLKVGDLSLTMIDPVHPELNELLLSTQQTKELSKEINALLKYSHNKKLKYSKSLEDFQNKLVINEIRSSYEIPCSIGWHYARILANGDVIPCCKASAHPIGNINNDSFFDIWHNDKYSTFRIRSKYMKENNNYFDFCFPCDNFNHNLDFYQEKLLHFQNMTKYSTY